MIIKKVTKKDGSVIYRGRQYLGIDSVTGKKVVANITGKSKLEVKHKANQKITDFNNKGRTHYNDRVQKQKKKQDLSSPVCFDELLELYNETIYKDSVKLSTFVTVESYVKNYVRPVWSNVAIKSITRGQLQKWVNELSKTVYQFNKPFGVVYRCLEFAVSLDIINVNPCNGVILPKKKKIETDKPKYFTLEQVKQLYEYLDNLNPFDFNNVFHSTLYKLALATGCRIGELVALEWSDIDFNKKYISISKTYDDKNHVITTPKSKNAVRLVYLDDKTIKLLKEFKKRQSLAFSKNDIKRVFLWSLEFPYPSYSALNKHLHEHLKKASLPVVGFHAFRHTHASMLIESGIDPKTLQVRLGHSKISTTLDIYSHISDEKEKTAVSYFEKAMNF